MRWLTTVAAWLQTTGVGDLVGFVASIAGLIGAWAAFGQARGAKIAARAAQRRLAEFDTIVTISAAIERLQALKVLHRDRRWEIALNRYAAYRRDLIAIRHRDRGLQDSEQAVIQDAIFLLAQMEAKVERIRDHGETADAASLNRLLSTAIDDLQSLLQRKQARSMESSDGR